MTGPRYPSLYQINTRTWLTDIARKLGHPTTLDDVPDAALDEIAAQGFDWVWLLSVWQTGPEARQVSRTNAQWRREFEATLPDLTDDDIPGSGFAITGYSVHQDLGGDAALAQLRERLKKRGLKLMLDFVPNHMGLGHPWIEDHPEFFVQGSELDRMRAPQNYIWTHRRQGDLLLAHGRDPYFDGWPDTLQLNYADPDMQEAMMNELVRIAGQCDGVRCDMAMLVLPEVFERTWGKRAPLFWPTATARVRKQVPGFTFMAEVYWDMEWTLQQQGFNYAYDKRLYDRLREHHARPVREHFHAGIDYQDKLARFLENHDEPRAAAAFPPAIQQAAAVLTFLSPGLRFFHQGQLEGHKIRISPHLGRGPDEPLDPAIQQFYNKLLAVLRRPAVRNGQWQLLDCTPGWEGNPTHDCLVAFGWQAGDERLVVVVNYAHNQSQGHAKLSFADLAGQAWQLVDQLGGASHDWHGDDLTRGGLYLDLKPWEAVVYALSRKTS